MTEFADKIDMAEIDIRFPDGVIVYGDVTVADLVEKWKLCVTPPVTPPQSGYVLEEMSR